VPVRFPPRHEKHLGPTPSAIFLNPPRLRSMMSSGCRPRGIDRREILGTAVRSMAEFFAWFQLLSIPIHPSRISRAVCIKNMGYQNARADHDEKYSNHL
jgi:hypothetical protein